MLTVSCLLASCTKEKLVMRDHEVSAEVGQLTTTEQKTLFCNLNDVENIDISSALDYVNAQMNNGVELVLLLAPASTIDEIDALCETNEYNKALSATDKVVAYAISKNPLTELRDVQNSTLGLSALFFDYNSTYYIVASLIKGTTEAECLQRTEQVSYIISETIDKSEYPGNAKWVFALNMNAVSRIDLEKYGRPYTDVEVDPEVGPTSELYAWQFACHAPLLANNLTDCVAAQFMNYPYIATEARYDFLYASPMAWMAMLPLEIDKSASYLSAGASLLQEDEDDGEGEGEGEDEGEDEPIVIAPVQSGTPAVYPIIFTLKSEER